MAITFSRFPILVGGIPISVTRKKAMAIDSEYVFDGLKIVVVLDRDNRKVELKSLGLNK